MTIQRLCPATRIGDLIFLAGQVPDDLSADIATQTRQVLERIESVLAEFGRTKADPASARIRLNDIGAIGAMNEVRNTWVDRDNPPARAIGGMRLARPGMAVKMVALACATS